MAKSESSRLTLTRSDKRPQLPVGSFYDVVYNSYIHTTNKKGFVNVDTHVLMFGRPANKLASNSIYTNPVTQALKELGL
tara:strand:- start:940 stop:1176 length:237 start_codon:yes stop_codon:yes gene_type:complete